MKPRDSDEMEQSDPAVKEEPIDKMDDAISTVAQADRPTLKEIKDEPADPNEVGHRLGPVVKEEAKLLVLRVVDCLETMDGHSDLEHLSRIYQLRMGSHLPTDSIEIFGSEAWMPLLEAAAGGKISITKDHPSHFLLVKEKSDAPPPSEPSSFVRPQHCANQPKWMPRMKKHPQKKARREEVAKNQDEEFLVNRVVSCLEVMGGGAGSEELAQIYSELFIGDFRMDCRNILASFFWIERMKKAAAGRVLITKNDREHFFELVPEAPEMPIPDHDERVDCSSTRPQFTKEPSRSGSPANVQHSLHDRQSEGAGSPVALPSLSKENSLEKREHAAQEAVAVKPGLEAENTNVEHPNASSEAPIPILLHRSVSSGAPSMPSPQMAAPVPSTFLHPSAIPLMSLPIPHRNMNKGVPARVAASPPPPPGQFPIDVFSIPGFIPPRFLPPFGVPPPPGVLPPPVFFPPPPPRPGIIPSFLGMPANMFPHPVGGQPAVNTAMGMGTPSLSHISTRERLSEQTIIERMVTCLKMSHVGKLYDEQMRSTYSRFYGSDFYQDCHAVYGDSSFESVMEGMGQRIDISFTEGQLTFLLKDAEIASMLPPSEQHPPEKRVRRGKMG